MQSDQVTVTQAMLKSTHIISMTEAAYWSAIQAAEQRGMERAAEIADDYEYVKGRAFSEGDIIPAQGAQTAATEIAQAIRQASKEQAI